MIIVRLRRLKAEALLLREIRIAPALQGIRLDINLRLLLVDHDHLFDVMLHDHRLNLPLPRLLGVLSRE